MSKERVDIIRSYMQKLCVDIPERPVGSEGNRRATAFFEREISSLGWKTDVADFEAIDWEDGGATLTCGEQSFKVFPSPYSTGCEITAELSEASSLTDLGRQDFAGKVLLLHGDIAREQLMPKNFVFYNPEEHQRIIRLLETGRPGAIVCATDRNGALAGGVYPFPLIEDGDFDIPSVYMTDEERASLIQCIGKKVTLTSAARRIPGKGYQVTARRGGRERGVKGAGEPGGARGRIVLAAHIDAKKGSPGAIDNATGVAVLLLLAGLLNDYDGDTELEIVAFNGEDYYCAPGQMRYISENQGRFDEILLNITIDGAGYKEGGTVLSFFNLPDDLKRQVTDVMNGYHGFTEGSEYPQGDHFIFVQYDRPAIAVSSAWLIENLEDQSITHTAADTVEIVDCARLAEIAEGLATIVRAIA